MTFDPQLLQDFLTESGELLERLDQDLIVLEGAPGDPELLNQVFRALHTIKGSASFLGLTNLVNIAHAAESALNAARNRVFTIDKPAMDLLLAGVDVIKQQFVELRAGTDLCAADATLIAKLTALGEGRAVSSATQATTTPAATASAPAAKPPAPAEETILQLPPGKAELLEFFIADLQTGLTQLGDAVNRLSEPKGRDDAGKELAAQAEAISKTAEFFECPSMSRLVGLLSQLAHKAGELSEPAVLTVLAQAKGVMDVLSMQCQGLASQKVLAPDTVALESAFVAALNEPETEREPTTPIAPDHVASTAPPPASARSEAKPADKTASSANSAHAPNAAEQTIRVDVSKLESLLNLVGELVLQKNRLSALTRKVVASNAGTQDLREQLTQATGGLDRTTSDLQTAVMKTRMQPLDKLFGKYPRLVRDLAAKLNKKIHLEIEGAETEVDKSVIEELGDPLVHLMRNSADHGIETPEQRRAAGKDDQGTIRLVASNSGGQVEIRIIDDGKGLHPDKIGAKAVEKGVVTPEQLATMSDRDKTRLIFAAGFSTAEKISDVSGRGVGMDVVRANVEKIKGTIDLQSVPGQGTTVIITIPLTVAIMNAMMVASGNEIYAVPLNAIVEIVKPSKEQLSTINHRSVMRLRETVLPLVDAGELFGKPTQGAGEGGAPFAVVLQHGEERVGLMVSQLIGQQEIVIKPLDEFIDKGGTVSGATVRDDGGVSLIVDVARVFEKADARRSA